MTCKKMPEIMFVLDIESRPSSHINIVCDN